VELHFWIYAVGKVVTGRFSTGLDLNQDVQGVFKKRPNFCYKYFILQHFKHWSLQSSPLYWWYTLPNVSYIVGILPGTHFLWWLAVPLSNFPETPRVQKISVFFWTQVKAYIDYAYYIKKKVTKWNIKISLIFYSLSNLCIRLFRSFTTGNKVRKISF
jgi:hypothetical protein